MNVNVLYNKQGKYLFQVAASTNKQVLQEIVKALEKRQEIESPVIETYTLYDDAAQYLDNLIERVALQHISGLHTKEQNDIMAYIEQLKAGIPQPCPVTINEEPYERK